MMVWPQPGSEPVRKAQSATKLPAKVIQLRIRAPQESGWNLTHHGLHAHEATMNVWNAAAASRGQAGAALRAARPKPRSWPVFAMENTATGAGISLTAAASSPGAANGSREPCTQNVGVRNDGKCAVRSSPGFCGGCNGYESRRRRRTGRDLQRQACWP